MFSGNVSNTHLYCVQFTEQVHLQLQTQSWLLEVAETNVDGWSYYTGHHDKNRCQCIDHGLQFLLSCLSRSLSPKQPNHPNASVFSICLLLLCPYVKIHHHYSYYDNCQPPRSFTKPSNTSFKHDTTYI